MRCKRLQACAPGGRASSLPLKIRLYSSNSLRRSLERNASSRKSIRQKRKLVRSQTSREKAVLSERVSNLPGWEN